MPKLIPQNKLKDWLDNLAQTHEVWVPQDQDGMCVIDLYQAEREINLESRTRFSAKELVFPQTERLFKYKYEKDKDNPEHVSVKLQTENNVPKRVAFGIPPCDVAGIEIISKVFDDKGYKDPYFKKRREALSIVALGCQHPENACFCTTVGGSPSKAPGADILLTPVGDGYAVEVLTAKGQALIPNDLFDKLADVDAPDVEKAQQKAGKLLPAPMVISPSAQTAQALLKAFASPYWNEATAACLSCGICTFACPTCHCFTIVDEKCGRCGERMRCWDACMFPLYTLEASGHNPRLAQSQRYRNRISHKYSYMITNNNILGCTGCGRCIKLCPAGIDLRRIVEKLIPKSE
ncbi:MAG: 4Fe-4S dicluster domain-containing protein [Candidatus Schekmanbacteria bacterium]|nr:4Fe-4S dicluster domain-containing protein [Candidatus Schekmanbacteria bacterium]